MAGREGPPRPSFHTASAGFETVDDMIRGRWDVYAECRRCRLRFKVSLPELAKLGFGGHRLWDRHPTCKVADCWSKVTYYGRPRSLVAFHALTSASRANTFPEGR